MPAKTLVAGSGVAVAFDSTFVTSRAIGPLLLYTRNSSVLIPALKVVLLELMLKSVKAVKADDELAQLVLPPPMLFPVKPLSHISPQLSVAQAPVIVAEAGFKPVRSNWYEKS